MESDQAPAPDVLSGDLFALTPEEACRIAVDKAGGPTAVSRAFKERGVTISPQAVDQWRIVPPRHARMLSELAGGQPSVHQLQPDVFGKVPPAEAAA